MGLDLNQGHPEEGQQEVIFNLTQPAVDLPDGGIDIIEVDEEIEI